MFETLRRVDIPHASEVIALEFENFFRVMPAYGLVFGGVLRDIIAGKDLVGDIDIMVDGRLAGETARQIAESAWWMRKDRHNLPSPKVALAYSKEGNHLQDQMNAMYPKWQTYVVQGRPELFGMDGEMGGPGGHPGGMNKKFGEGLVGYAKPPTRRSDNPYNEMGAISGKHSFVNEDGRELQLVTTKRALDQDPKVSALMSCQNLDLVCCGFVMTQGGIVYELVKDAEEQAKAGVLRVNTEMEHYNLVVLAKRVKKLLDRGWKDEVDWDHVHATNAKWEKAKAKKKKATPKKVQSPRVYIRYNNKTQELITSFAAKILPAKQRDHAQTFQNHLPGQLGPKIHKRGMGFQVICKLSEPLLDGDIPKKEHLQEYLKQAHMIANALHLTLVNRLPKLEGLVMPKKAKKKKDLPIWAKLDAEPMQPMEAYPTPKAAYYEAEPSPRPKGMKPQRAPMAAPTKNWRHVSATGRTMREPPMEQTIVLRTEPARTAKPEDPVEYKQYIMSNDGSFDDMGQMENIVIEVERAEVAMEEQDMNEAIERLKDGPITEDTVKTLAHELFGGMKMPKKKKMSKNEIHAKAYGGIHKKALKADL